MQIYKKWLILSLLSFLPFLLILVILLYLYDPFQFFHKPYFRKETFNEDIRVQAKVIIERHPFDSVILGSSMLENTPTKKSTELLGGKWVNLSMAGGTLDARSVLLHHIFKHKDIKQIIYSIDAFTLNSTKETRQSFEFVYTEYNFLTPFKIYLNFKKPKYILCALSFSKDEECVGKDPENLLKWKRERLDKSFEDGLDNMSMQAIQNMQEFSPQNNLDIKENQKYIQKYLLTFIKDNPQTQFHLIIPNYSRILYKMYLQNSYYNVDSSLFSRYRAVLKWLITEIQKYPNAKIYGFDDLDYANDLKNYTDAPHYRPDMNLKQLEAIKNQSHILTPQNMDNYFEIFEEKIRNFDTQAIEDLVKKKLKK